MLIGLLRGAAGHLVRRRCRRAGAGQRDRRRPTPTSTHVVSFVGGAQRLDRQHRHDVRRAQAARQRKARADEVIARLRPKLVAGPRHHALPAGGAGRARRRPRVAHAVPVHAQDAEPRRAPRPGRRKMLERAAQAARAARRRAPISRPPASSWTSTIDRDTAARLGITPQAIDDTLYDAFGQRQVATSFTPLNQYRVVLEATPALSRPAPTQLDARLRARRRTARRCRCRAIAKFGIAPTPAVDQPPGPVPRDDALVQPGARRRARAGGRRAIRARRARRSACRPASTPAFRARRRPSSASLSSEPWLILAALLAVYIVLGMLYESLIHPITILSTLPSAGAGRAARAARAARRVQHHRAHRRHPAASASSRRTRS